jgi:DNA repair exonuclease SbcCD nuclease subunit
LRALLIGDIHARDTSPANRHPGYLDEIIDLLTQAATIQSNEGIECVVLAGDIFDFKRPGATSHATIIRLIHTLRLFTNPYVVTGNHDIRNDRLDSLDSQPLGVLIAANVLTPLDGWEEEHGWPIFGLPWLQDWMDPNARRDALEDWREGAGDNALIVTHAPIYPPAMQSSQMFDLVPTHGPNSLSEAMDNTGHVYYGHIHEDHGIFTDDGVTYCNVGALSRGSLNEHNTSRAIQVAVWDEDNGFTTRTLDYQPADSIFKIATVLDSKAEAKSLDEFLSAVGSATLDISSTASAIDYIHTRTDVEPRIRNRAIHILEEVESNG